MATRVLMIGAGSVARRHVEVLTGLPDVRVEGVVDPVERSARELAADCDARSFADVGEALDSVDPDAVYVCVPPFAHGSIEDAVLERDLPFFVEKPVSVDLATAERIAARIADRGLVTGTGYHWRCSDVVPRAQHLLADGHPPVLATGYWLDKRPPVSWWARMDQSGGQVVEQLTHVLDLARLLLGEPVEVYAAGARQAEPATAGTTDGADLGDVDDATAATVRFASGAVATFVASSLLRAKHRAALHTYSPGLVLELSEAGLVVDDGDGRKEHAPSEDPKVVVDREFIAAVRGERDAAPTPYAEALESHRLACAVADSAREGLPVALAAPEMAVR